MPDKKTAPDVWPPLVPSVPKDALCNTCADLDGGRCLRLRHAMLNSPPDAYVTDCGIYNEAPKPPTSDKKG